MAYEVFMRNQSSVSTGSAKCTFLDVVQVHRTSAIVATTVSTTALNSITAIFAAIGNFLVILLIVKYRRLRTPANALIASLCVSDLLVGSVVQPLSCVRRCLEVFSQHNCAVRIMYAYTGFVCVLASLQAIALVSIDRTAAVLTPFGYPTFARTRRYVVATAAMWSFTLLITTLPFLGVMNLRIFFFLLVGVALTSTVTVAVCYILIYRVARKQAQNIAMQNVRNSAKSGNHSHTKTCAVIVGVLLLCYSPQIVVLFLRGAFGDNESLIYIVDVWVDFIVFLNSSLNPVIYGCRMQEFRLAFLNLIGRDQRIRSATYLDEQVFASSTAVL